MRHKLILFVSLSIISVLLMISFVNATCDESQRIMKLSSANNAHGEVYNQGFYNMEICYNSIFGSPYTGSNPHTCTLNNVVLKLSASTNAHAEIKSLDNYPIDVCYGDLVCNARTTCNADEKLVVSLSADSNAHLSNGTDYPVKICCKSGGIPIGNRYWADMRENSITQSQLGDTVKMIFKNTGLSQGTEVTFEIYEKDAVGDLNGFPPNDGIRTISLGSGITASVNASGDAVGLWTITNFDLEETDDLEEFIFIVRGGESNEMAILETPSNSPPHAIILTPIPGIYKVNQQIGFTQASYDLDDELDTTWYSNNQPISEEWNFTYSYTTAGQKNIKLKVQEATRNKVAYNSTSILIINSTGRFIFANITKPGFGQAFPGKEVEFDGKGSFAIEVINGVISCIAGNCPTATADGTTISNSPKSIDAFEFKWQFSDDNWQTELIPYSGTGLNGAYLKRNFALVGKHWTKLTATLNQDSSLTESEFFTEIENGYCDDDGFTWIDNLGQEYDTILTPICGEDINAKRCCPGGYSCQIDPEDINYKKCQLEPDFCFDLGFCSNYLDEENCTDDLCNLGERGGLEWDITTGNYPACGKETSINGVNYSTSCEGCEWENEECKFPRTFSEVYNPSASPVVCSRTTTAGECIDGIRTLSWTETPQREPCNDGTKDYPCGAEAMLSFFGLFQFIISSLLILIFYLMRKNLN